MADDKRLIILTRISEVLKTIALSNGYQHDLSTKVYRGRTAFDPENDPTPIVTVFERGEVEEQANYATIKGQLAQQDWALVLQGFVVGDNQNPIDPAYRLMADCKKCLSTIGQEGHTNYQLKNDTYTKKLVDDINLSPGIVLTPSRDTSQNYIQFILFFTVNMVESTADPYQLFL